ncbi:MAG TPA: glycosyl hydrolase, partial [Cytophagaceae bacterium]
MQKQPTNTIGTKLTLALLFQVFFSSSDLHAQLQSEWKNRDKDISTVEKKFAQPPLFYAPHTFWFWESALDTLQVKEMARTISSKRINPGYPHPRGNFFWDTTLPSLPYHEWLSPLWFKAYENSLKEASKAGTHLGFVNDYMWPMGWMGGRMLKAYPDLEAKSLKWEKINVVDGKVITVPKSKFAVAAQKDVSGRLITSSMKLIGEGDPFQWQAPEGSWIVFIYNLYNHKGVDGGVVNYLDPTLADRYLDLGHKPYIDKFSDKLGKTLGGVFMDNEGDYGWGLPWSEYLPIKHFQMKSQDVRLWMPLLTEKDTEGKYIKARYDWFDVVSEIYSKDFWGKLSNYLENKNMYLISNLWEENNMMIAQAVGDLMRVNRQVSMPGIDLLFMRALDVHDFKETQSVAEFEQKPFMAEIMGWQGWQQTPVDVKRAINATTASGINHTVFHGISTNRDYSTQQWPADWYTQNPYWNHMEQFSDYTRRTNYLNKQSRISPDILLLNPLESFWINTEAFLENEPYPNWAGKTLKDRYPSWSLRALQIDSLYDLSMKALEENQMDFLIADAHYMNSAKVKDQNGINIKGINFKTVVVPPMEIMSHKVADKLLQFASNGGQVVLTEFLPKHSTEQGENDKELQKKLAKLSSLPTTLALNTQQNIKNSLPQAIKKSQPQAFELVSGNDSLFFSHRKLGASDMYWIANKTGRKEKTTFTLRDGTGKAEKYNCEDGSRTPLYYKREDKRTLISYEFESYEGFWIIFNPNEKASIKQAFSPSIKETVLQENWKVSLPSEIIVKISSAPTLISSDDALTQKAFDKQYKDSSWRHQNLLGDVAIMEPWKSKVFYFKEENSSRYYRKTFNLNQKVSRAFITIAGDDMEFIWVNGKKLLPGKNAESFDKFDVYDITANLQKGKNIIAVEIQNKAYAATMFMQADLLLANKELLTIVSDDTWKSTSTKIDKWQNINYKDNGWSLPEFASAEETANRFKLAGEKPVLISNAKKVWWKINLPLGASSMTLPGLDSNVHIWVNGKKANIRNQTVELPINATMALLRIDPTQQKTSLLGPLEFKCDRSVYLKYSSGWADMGLYE